MPIIKDEDVEVETLQKNWILRRGQTEPGSFLSISFVDRIKESEMINHQFTNTLDFLPNPSVLPLRPDLPSFMLQLPDNVGEYFYKVWYSKENKQLLDIWEVQASTGERRKIPREGINSNLRAGILEKIENLIGASEQEICDYFARAHDLEIQLSNLLADEGMDVPNHHSDPVS